MARHDMSALDEFKAVARRRARLLWAWARGPGRQLVGTLSLAALHQLRRNLAPRRLFSFPHALFVIWVVILLWGERWVFETKIADCDWHTWEHWPKEARPHHLVFIADPQLIDPHSYPGRPWPLNPLTVLVTDNYMRRGYNALQRQLNPDSVFFLGDLFDGGREWKTKSGSFVDPKWGSSRSSGEKKWVKTWHRKYGEDFWVREYQRFSNIFFDNFNAGGSNPGPMQRGKKLVASLPGNHDLGFGAQIQVPVRDRFAAFFGDVNRVDVVGNHTIVSVDTVSLSAETSQFKGQHNLRPIYGPAKEFLENVQSTKRKLVQEELSVWHDTDRDLRLGHKVEDIDKADTSRWPRDPGPGAPDFPTILLTHVPLYRAPGTPCGPQREHWPPTKPPKGQTGVVNPDNRNAITVAGGYQYQNVLNEETSAHLIKSVGNVVHVFSGDDHDYCEVKHSASKGGVREITVKSFSMAMGVPTPGFLMVSMYNPVGADGKPTGEVGTTLQTHLCLMPNQIHTFMKYVTFIILSLVLLTVRAFLVPVLNLQPFALEPEQRTSVLPLFKDKAKAEPPDYSAHRNNSYNHHTSSLSTASNGHGNGNGARWSSKKSGKRARQWGGWAGDRGGGGIGGGPRIKLDADDFYDGGKGWKGSGTRGAGSSFRTLGRELWTTMWRVAWMTVLLWAYLARKG
ncbi:hypothetical protein PLIIFM63780_003260 [Purpureocillium lilacinum]|nr:hypothetical protein PLIIFM63780_003260 [Purpureocillium lilacinum]